MNQKIANDIVADNIRRLRKKKSMSQEDVVNSLQTMGIDITRGRLSMIETKKRTAPALLIAGLRLIFACEYHDFFLGVEDELAPNLVIYKKKSKT